MNELPDFAQFLLLMIAMLIPGINIIVAIILIISAFTD